MTATRAAYVHTNGYDALVIVDPDNGNRMHQIGDDDTFRDAVDAPGDLDNWSGYPADAAPEDIGDVLLWHEADGTTTTIDAAKLAQRRAFFGA